MWACSRIEFYATLYMYACTYVWAVSPVYISNYSGKEVSKKERLCACITHSHGSVLKATKQVNGKGQTSTLATPKPLNRSSQKLAGMITSWMAPGMQNILAIDSGVSASQIRDFAVPFDVTSFYVRFWGSSIRLQPTSLNGYLRKIRQMTSFRVRKCLLGVPMTIFSI